MKNPGVFAVSRAIFDHPMFKDEKFNESLAWLWMCGAAAFKPMRVRVGRHLLNLERGQLAFSERFMAKKFKWSKTTLHRFVERLENESMVDRNVDRDITILTVCNYDKYAFDGERYRTTDGPQSGPEVDQKRTKEEELKELKETTSSDLEEDFRDAPIESPSKATSTYAFEGKVAKLNQKNYDLWKRAFSFLDLAAELIARDAYLTSDRATDADRKNWFASTAQHFTNRNQKAKHARQPQQIQWRSGTEGVL